MEPSLEAEPKVHPSPTPAQKKMLKGRRGARHPEGRGRRPGAWFEVLSIKRRRQARVRMAFEFKKEAAKAAAPPPPKPRPPAPKGEAALRPLSRILDRLSGVAATARRPPRTRSATSARAARSSRGRRWTRGSTRARSSTPS